MTDDLVHMWAIWDGFGALAAVRHSFAFVASMTSLAQTVMGTWHTGVLPHVLPYMASDWTLDRLYCEDVVPGTVAPIDFAGSVGDAGSDTGSPVPGQSSVITTWYSDLRGRSNRGRTFWPGLAVSALTSGVLGPVPHSAFVDYANAMLDAFTPRIAPPAAQFGTLSKQLDGAPRGPVLMETTFFTVRNSLGSVRRRRPGF